jgi:Fic family protein
MIKNIDKRLNSIDTFEKKENIKIPDTKKKFLQLIITEMNNKLNLLNLFPNEEKLEIILEQVNDLKKSLDSFRPLEGVHIDKLNDYFDEVYTYDSTTIEGNTLTLQETALVLNKGVTIGGKSLREHFEIINHKEALDHIKEIVKNNEPFNKMILLDIHHLILKNIDVNSAGKYRNIDVMISGSQHKPPTYLQVQNLMDEYFNFYEENKDKLNPVILATEMHERLVTIHPFTDGNGRTSRLIMNLILLQHGFPVTNISSQNNSREDYYNCLETAQTKDDKSLFHKFIANNVKEALIKYLEIISVNGDETTKGEYFYTKCLEYSNNKDKK